MSRFTIDITEQEHQQLKAEAARCGKTIRRYARARPFKPEVLEISDELRSVLQARLDEALTEKVPYKTVQDILAEELGELHE